MTAFDDVPAGPGRNLLVRRDWRDAALAAGLEAPAAWEAALTGSGSGRGRAGRLDLPQGALSLKRMRRRVTRKVKLRAFN